MKVLVIKTKGSLIPPVNIKVENIEEIEIDKSDVLWFDVLDSDMTTFERNKIHRELQDLFPPNKTLVIQKRYTLHHAECANCEKRINVGDRMIPSQEVIMEQWDSWRRYFANGGGGTWPRGAFESLLDAFEEREVDCFKCSKKSKGE